MFQSGDYTDFGPSALLTFALQIDFANLQSTGPLRLSGLPFFCQRNVDVSSIDITPRDPTTRESRVRTIAGEKSVQINYGEFVTNDIYQRFDETHMRANTIFRGSLMYHHTGA